MAVSLATAVESDEQGRKQLADERAAAKAKREQRAASIEYSGETLMRDIRAALAASGKRWKLSSDERDALAQTVALRALTHERMLHTADDSGQWVVKSYGARRAEITDCLTGLIRDSRQWRDSEDGWQPRDRPTTQAGRDQARAVKKARGTISWQEQTLTIKQQRALITERAAPLLTSWDALQAMYQTDDGRVDRLAMDEHHAAEQDAGRALPAPAYVEDSRVLTRALARQLVARAPLGLARERDIRAALYRAAGDNLTAIALAEHKSLRTIASRASMGDEQLAWLGKDEVITARRDCAAKLGLIDPSNGTALTEIETASGKAIDAVWRERAASYNGSRADSHPREHASPWNGPRSYALGHGPAADVLAYISAVERTTSERAVWTLDTSDSTPAPPPAASGYRHQRTAWAGIGHTSERHADLAAILPAAPGSGQDRPAERAAAAERVAKLRAISEHNLRCQSSRLHD